ncbi:MAG: AAA family ATPase, partial [Methanosarcina vacuolata]|nr:AAA family ATPase [Methanosarcina vacuolata]
MESNQVVYLSDNAYFRTIELEAENKNSPRLSDHQRRLVNITADQRKSIFLTGPAGTGKSFLLRTIIDQMKIVYKEENQVAVTAATGMAAYL